MENFFNSLSFIGYVRALEEVAKDALSVKDEANECMKKDDEMCFVLYCHLENLNDSLTNLHNIKRAIMKKAKPYTSAHYVAIDHKLNVIAWDYSKARCKDKAILEGCFTPLVVLAKYLKEDENE
jgi:hypothetical protein